MSAGYEDEATGLIDKTKRDAVLLQRYEEEEVVKSEQESWEEQQIAMASAQFGARDGRDTHEYELVMDDQIDFISSQILKGESSQLKKETD
jgi:uncharacterized Zn ribbon protein